MKLVKAGFLTLNKSVSSTDIEAFLIATNLRVEENRPTSNVIRTRAYLPNARFNIEEQELITFIDIVKRVVGTTENLLNFKKNLSSKIVCIDMESGTIIRHGKEKAKKEKVLEVFA
jgi:hypothetical protein